MLPVWYQKGPWLLEAHQEKSRKTRHSGTTIQWRSCSKSVLRARQKRLALSYKQPPARPGKDILYVPFPLLPADRFALTINLPCHPHRAFVSIPLPLLRRGKKVKPSSSLVPKRIAICSAARSWMDMDIRVDMLLPRHPHKSHLDCSALTNPSMTSLNWAEHHNTQKKLSWHFSGSQPATVPRWRSKARLYQGGYTAASICQNTNQHTDSTAWPQASTAFHQTRPQEGQEGIPKDSWTVFSRR